MNRSDPRYRHAVQEVRKDPRSKFCFLSGEQIKPGTGDPHHVLPVSQFPEWAYRKLNIVIVTRKAHDIITSGTAQEIARLPRIHNLLARMRTLDPEYYEKYYEKLSAWLITGWK